MPVYNAAQKVISSFKVPVLSKYLKADDPPLFRRSPTVELLGNSWSPSALYCNETGPLSLQRESPTQTLR